MIYTFDPRRDPRWTDWAAKQPLANAFCSSGWLEALARTYGYRPRVYTTSAPGAPLENAVVMCEVRSRLTGRRLVSLPFSDHCEALVGSQQEMDEVVQALRAEVDSGAYGHFELRQASVFGGLRNPSPEQAFLLHELDLRPSLDEIFRRFHNTGVQQMIRRADREGLVYEAGTSEHLLRDFYALMLLTRRRHQLPPAPLAWFRNVLQCLPQQACIRVARKDGRPIGAIFTVTFGKVVLYKYGCSDATQHKLGGMAMLLWRAIQEARAQGIEIMDFGRSEPENTGLITFKERWGAKPTPLHYYRYPASPAHSSIRQKANRYVGALFGLAPDCVLTAAGSMLYRHIG